jgi:bifunctional DNA-binding transcriptional regulator/antitoxin component of YhaV-PrlF toxin-antitoxin module
MKAVEFQSTVTANGQIAIPAEIAGQLPLGEPLRVVVQWDGTDDEDAAWRTQGRQRFEAAYAPEDSVYDQLMDGGELAGRIEETIRS